MTINSFYFCLILSTLLNLNLYTTSVYTSKETGRKLNPYIIKIIWLVWD